MERIINVLSTLYCKIIEIWFVLLEVFQSTYNMSAVEVYGKRYHQTAV